MEVLQPSIAGLSSLERTPDDYTTSHMKLHRMEKQSYGALSELLKTDKTNCPRRARAYLDGISQATGTRISLHLWFPGNSSPQVLQRSLLNHAEQD